LLTNVMILFENVHFCDLLMNFCKEFNFYLYICAVKHTT
jgi:hypothetical protein